MIYPLSNSNEPVWRELKVQEKDKCVNSNNTMEETDEKHYPKDSPLPWF